MVPDSMFLFLTKSRSACRHACRLCSSMSLTFQVDQLPKDALHWEHAYGLTPRWLRQCRISDERFAITLPQMWHWRSLSSSSDSLWRSPASTDPEPPFACLGPDGSGLRGGGISGCAAAGGLDSALGTEEVGRRGNDASIWYLDRTLSCCHQGELEYRSSFPGSWGRDENGLGLAPESDPVCVLAGCLGANLRRIRGF
jgi:hypothetical protein